MKDLRTTVIADVMTPMPHTISAKRSLDSALETMTELGVRHLPVMENDQLIGIVTEQDIRLIQSTKKINASELIVGDAFTQGPYSVKPDTLLTELCADMALRKKSWALVVEGTKLVGIFTWIDALKVISEIK